MWLQSSFNIVWNLGWLFRIPEVSSVCVMCQFMYINVTQYRESHYTKPSNNSEI